MKPVVIRCNCEEKELTRISGQFDSSAELRLFKLDVEKAAGKLGAGLHVGQFDGGALAGLGGDDPLAQCDRVLGEGSSPCGPRSGSADRPR
jgi:hypothetical protein